MDFLRRNMAREAARNPASFIRHLVIRRQKVYIAADVVVSRQLKRTCLNSRPAFVRAWTRQSNFR
jgi:hypothetical protein